jgi:hypothetical protein
MASILKVDTIQDQSGNNIINENADTITIGASGDTITIPSGASITLTDGVSGDFKMNSGYGSVETAYGVRVWLRYDQVNNVVEASGGVSSVTDGGTGVYTINFTNTMPDADYALGGWSGRNAKPIVTGSLNDHNVGSIQINTGSIDGTGSFVLEDVDDTTVIIVK